ncbi:MAG: hypothetical protein JNM02_06015 [Anaerolineales bacterium]|nr:hypothetical protein [Anaerolineales bacterium]
MMPRENPFPFVVKALTDLPQEFQQAVQSYLPEEESIHSILMLPPQPFMKRGGVPRQALLSTTHGMLHVQDGKPLTANYLPAESLIYIHHKLILLYGSLEVAVEVNGELVRAIAEYNTVGQYLLDNTLRQFLQMRYNPNLDETTREQNKAILDQLNKESFKFMNGLRLYALRPGERLLGYVFQPRIKEQFLRFFSRPIAPTSIFALTDQSIVLVEEDKARGASYGWVITICPRKVVLNVESKPMQKWQKFSVLLMKNNVNMERNLILEHDTALACKALWASRISPA